MTGDQVLKFTRWAVVETVRAEKTESWTGKGNRLMHILVMVTSFGRDRDDICTNQELRNRHVF
jgi:hypothetical protein